MDGRGGISTFLYLCVYIMYVSLNKLYPELQSHCPKVRIVDFPTAGMSVIAIENRPSWGRADITLYYYAVVAVCSIFII